MTYGAVDTVIALVKLDKRLDDGKTESRAHLRSSVEFIYLIVSVPNQRKLVGSNSVAGICYLDPDIISAVMFGKALPDYDRLVVSRMGNGIVYKVVEHLQDLLSVGKDRARGCRHKTDVISVLVDEFLIPDGGFLYYFGNVEPFLSSIVLA